MVVAGVLGRDRRESPTAPLPPHQLAQDLMGRITRMLIPTRLALSCPSRARPAEDQSLRATGTLVEVDHPGAAG